MSNWLRRTIVDIIARCIPRRGKRIIYITLCYLIWSGSQEDDRILAEMIEINNKLHLSADDGPLRFAIELRNILLDVDDFRYLQTLPREKMEHNMVSYMPQWLKYDNDGEIINDLAKVLKPRYIHTATA